MSGFDNVSVITDVAPTATAVGENDLAIVGFCTTIKLATFDAGPAGSNVVLTPEVVLGFVPATVLVTLNEIVQPAAPMAMPVMLIAVWPAVKLTAGVIEQPAPEIATVCAALDVMFTRVSVNWPAVWATPPGLVSTNCVDETAPIAIVLGTNDLAIPINPTPNDAGGEGGPAVGVWVVVTPPDVLT